jgi:hypothetical protein
MVRSMCCAIRALARLRNLLHVRVLQQLLLRKLSKYVVDEVVVEV